MHLIIGRYLESNMARDRELLCCLVRNCMCEHIEAVHVIRESPDAVIPQHSKIVPWGYDERLTFELAFRFANAELAGQRVIVANADIWFDGSLAALDGFDLTDKLLCLSRWDLMPTGYALFDSPMSQDAWIFQSPILEFPCGWHLGRLGCENALAWQATNAGLRVSNPSRTLRANHEHSSGIRHWSETERLKGPYLAVPPDILLMSREGPNA
jgi:hypothetical protein